MSVCDVLNLSDAAADHLLPTDVCYLHDMLCAQLTGVHSLVIASRLQSAVEMFSPHWRLLYSQGKDVIAVVGKSSSTSGWQSDSRKRNRIAQAGELDR